MQKTKTLGPSEWGKEKERQNGLEKVKGFRVFFLEAHAIVSLYE